MSIEPMPGLSASQELMLEQLTRLAPGPPPILIRRRAMEGIHHEVSEAFASAPHRCAETGGILLGHRDDDRILVEDFEPVPSEHQFGPCYRLSDPDLDLLRETLDWFRRGEQPGLTVLGFYRSHTLPDFDHSAEDEDLMRLHFAPGEDLLLLVKPSFMGGSDQDFSLRRIGHPRRSPPPPPPALVNWPAPRARQSFSDSQSDPAPRANRRRWPWYIGASLLGLVCGAFTYHWTHPVLVLPAPVAQTAPPPQPAAPPPPAAAGGEPAPPDPTAVPVRDFIDRWAAALKRGDAAAAAQCYAPVVDNYFNRRDVTRDAVRQTVIRARARYGRLEAYRISGLTTTSFGNSQAVATFRKHWQFAGRARSSGEEAERMTLVLAKGNWQITSEQAAGR